MKVAMVGGLGDIGLAGVLPALSKAGHEVTAITRNEPKFLLPKGARHFVGDYHGDGFAQMIRGQGFEALISMITMNEADADILLAAAGPEAQIVFISTVCVYGGQLARLPADENTTINPITSYGMHKFLAEERLRRCRERGPLTIFRLASTPSPTAKLLRQLSITEGWLERARVGKPIIAGTNSADYWSWCAAEDAGVAIAAAVGREICYDQIYNLTGPNPLSWDDYHQRAAKEFGCKREIEIVRIRPEVIQASRVPHRLFAEQSAWGQVYGIGKLVRDIPEFDPKVDFERMVWMRQQWTARHRTGVFDSDADKFEDELIKTLARCGEIR